MVVLSAEPSTERIAPQPSEATLRAVASHLARSEGVVGAEVVVAGPRYRTIAARGTLVVAPGADPAEVVRMARDELDAWLDPIDGERHLGWTFGAPVRWDVAVRLLLDTVPGLVALSNLAFEVDGRRQLRCEDVDLAADELTWPGQHVLEVTVQGGLT